jgi:iron(III) transport system ATP-binding protein
LLIQQPKLLLLDEPFSNLDRVLKSVLKEVIDDIGKKLKITCILVSHDPSDTLPWADEILVLKAGKIIQRATPNEIYRKPVNTYVAGLFGTYTVLGTESIKKLGIKTVAKKVIVRPEHFQLVAKGPKTISGQIEKIHFLGTYLLLEIQAKEQFFYVATIENKHVVGVKVHLRII